MKNLYVACKGRTAWFRCWFILCGALVKFTSKINKIQSLY